MNQLKKLNAIHKGIMAFDAEVERQEQKAKDWAEGRVREIVEHYKLTKSDLLKIAQDMEDD